MITRVEIKGFRSCRDVVLDGLVGLTALIGRNASGKTTILKSIQSAARFATDPDFQRGWSISGNPHPVTIALRINIDNSHFEYKIIQKYKIKKTKNSKKLSVIKFLEEQVCHETVKGKWSPLVDRRMDVIRIVEEGHPKSIKVGASMPALLALSSLLPDDSSVLSVIRPLIRFLQSVRYYPLDEPSDSDEPALISTQSYQEWLNHCDATGNPGKSVLIRLLDLYGEPARFEELEALIGAEGLGIIDQIHVSEVEPHSGSRTREPEAQLEPGNLFKVEFRQSRRSGGGQSMMPHAMLSLGTRRLLRIMVSSVFDKSAVMLIEHPEDGIHFGLARKLIHLLRTGSDHVQTILTSHSSDVLNVLRPEEVRLVTMSEGATQVRALSPQELEAAAHYIRDEGTLTDFLRIVQED